MLAKIFKSLMCEPAKRLLGPFDRWAYRRFFDYPFGKSPRASRDTYMKIWKEAKAKSYPVIDEFEKKYAHAIDPKWLHDLALLTQVVIKDSEICYQHGRLLYAALSDYLAKNKNITTIHIVETGTARGFSSICMAKALKDAGCSGQIFTLDVLPHDVKMYWNCIADENGPRSREKLLEPYRAWVEPYIVFIQGDSKLQLKKVSLPRIRFAFLDGAHTYDYVLKEFEAIRDKQQKGDIIFFDDYTPDLFPGIVKAVDKICEKYDYSKEIISLNEQRGYVIARKK